MPRRTRPSRRRGRIFITTEQRRDWTYEQIARDLVRRGLCTPNILDHPDKWAPTQGDN